MDAQNKICIQSCMIHRRVLTVIPICLALAVPLVEAQAISGDLLGNCFDASRAVISGAQIDAVAEATNVHYRTKADAQGSYHFVNLPVGKYDVTVTAPGFSPSTSTGVEVKLNQPSTLDLTLAAGEVATNVSVSAAAVTLDTTTAQIENSFSPAVIQNLPTASTGSGVLNMSLLDAGIQMTGGLGLGGGPSVSGERPYNNNFTIEGVDNNNKSVHSPLITVPNDAVADFTVLQNQFSPEFGHSSGGQFNQVVMSGTNQFHGRAYEYFENRNLNALDYAYKRSGTFVNPRFDSNRFGGQLGGPVLHNKLFFFQNFEYNPIGRSGGATTIFSPTAAGYTTLNSIAGLSQTNLQELQKYLAPAATASSTITVHDAADNAIAIPTGTLPIIAPSFTNNLTAVSSVDYDISPEDSLRLRYIYFKQDTPDTSPNLPVFYGTSPTRSHLINISEYHTFSPHVTNEGRIGFNRTDNDTPSPNFTFPGLDTFPSFTFADLQLQFGPDVNAPQYTIQNTYQVVDNLAWQIGRHDLRFGAEGRKYISPQSFVQRSHGEYDYNALDTYLHDLSPDVLGERSVGVPVYYGDQIAFYWYANDSYRLTPDLTLNAGVRYEYTTVPYSERLQALNSLASVPGLINFDKPTSPKANFAPRGGFAWQPKGTPDLVVRGGVGLAYDALYDNIGITTLPPELNKTEDVPSLVNLTPNFIASGALPPGTGEQTTYATPAAARTATSAAIANNQLYPYSFNYNLGIEKSFAKNYFAEVRYVGSRGGHLNVQDQINRRPVVTAQQFLPTYLTAPTQAELNSLTTTLAGLTAQSTFDPTYAAAGFNSSTITEYLPLGASNYQGLQTQLNKRYSNGLEFQTSYTYSKNIDNDSADFYASDLDPRRVQNVHDIQDSRALSSLDRRHRFTFGGYYDLPFFRGSSNWWLKNLVGNYTVAPFYQVESAEHATVQSHVDSNLNNDSAGDRAVLNPKGVKNTGSGVNPLMNSAGQTVAYLAINPNAQYIQAGVGALANAGRNTLPLPRLDNLDMTVTKGVNFRDHYRVEFSAQAYNVLNHHQFIPGHISDVAAQGGFAGDVLYPQSGTFDQWSSVFGSNPRTMQLVAKFSF
jgi:hypothetical protein